MIDNNVSILKHYGIVLPTQRDRLKSILIQLGIPEGKILLGKEDPGGGTLAELERTKTIMLQRKFQKAIIVTNWWHTRRTNRICRRVFDGTDIRIYVVAAKNDISKPSNWWKYRYEAIRVLEEFFKLIIFFLVPCSNIHFDDDPSKYRINGRARRHIGHCHDFFCSVAQMHRRDTTQFGLL